MHLGLLIAVILAALAYDFMNGMHDCANAIATVVSTRATCDTIAAIRYSCPVFWK